MKHWKLDIIRYWVIGAGWLIEKKSLELSPSPPNHSNNFRKISALLIYIKWLSLVGWWFVVQKIYSKRHPVSSTNTHHDVTNLVNHGMVQNTKTWISRERNITFLWNKKILNLCLRWYTLRSLFVVELTFNLWFNKLDKLYNKNF